MKCVSELKWQNGLLRCSARWKISNFRPMEDPRLKFAWQDFRCHAMPELHLIFRLLMDHRGWNNRLLSPDVTLSVNEGADLCFRNCNVMNIFSESLAVYAKLTWKSNKLRTRNALEAVNCVQKIFLHKIAQPLTVVSYRILYNGVLSDPYGNHGSGSSWNSFRILPLLT